MNSLAKIWVISAAVLVCAAGRGVCAPTVGAEVAVATGTEGVRVGATLATGTNANAFICWGKSDGGVLSTGSWEHVVSVGAVTEGVAFFSDLVGLDTNASYWFRAYVTNTSGDAWSTLATSMNGIPFAEYSDPVGGAKFEWDAAQDTPGDSTWTSTESSYTWTFDNGATSPVSVVDERFDALTDAYEFPAAKDEDNVGWNSYGSSENATFEFVIDTDSDDGVIFETGGVGIGLMFEINNAKLQGVIASDPDNVFVTYPLTSSDSNRFIHAVFVITFNGASDTFELYVDNELKDSQTVAFSSDDWSGGNNAGFGATITDTPDLVNRGEFDGKMALFRFYQSTALTAEEVSTNFYALGVNGPLRTLAPEAVSSNSASMAATLKCPNSSNTVFVYYDTVDHGTNLTWAYGETLGTWTNVLRTNLVFQPSLNAETEYYYTFRSVTATGETWAGSSWRLTTLPGYARIENSAATGATHEAASFNGSLTAPTDTYSVYVHWNPINGEEDIGLWTNSAYVGAWTNVASTNLTHWQDGLLDNTRYYYTFRATNATTNVWAAISSTFTTLTTPVVGNGGGATDMAADSATLQGRLSSGVSATAFICWGTNDAGTVSASDWEHVEAIGTVLDGDIFSVGVSALTTNATYWYRVFVTNSAGADWLDSAEYFHGIPAAVQEEGRIVVGINMRYSDGSSILSSDVMAGMVVAHTNWNNTDKTSVGITTNIFSPVSEKLVDSSGIETPLEVVWDYDGTWLAGNWATGDNKMMNGYLDNWFIGPDGSTLSISNIPTHAYHVVAYFGAGTDDRPGTIGIEGHDTYSYSTHSAGKSFPDDYLRATDTGTEYPEANYAVWSNLTDSAFTLRQIEISGNSGLHGLQVIMRTDLGTIQNLAPTMVSTNGAMLNALLSSPGSTNTVYVHWGTVDAGANFTWYGHALVGSWTNVATVQLSYPMRLRGDTEYFYTFRIVNDSGDTWASPSWRVRTNGEGVDTVNHVVPYQWLAARDATWTNDYEAAALDDPDSDGFATWKEYWSGTDPRDGASFLQLDAARISGTNVVLEWQHKLVSPGLPALGIERSQDLLAGPWSLMGQNAPLDGSNIWVGTAMSNDFYRLSVTNAP